MSQESQAEEDESGSRAAQGDGAEASQGLEAVFAHRRSHRDAAAAADLRLQGTAVLRHCADRLAHLADQLDVVDEKPEHLALVAPAPDPLHE